MMWRSERARIQNGMRRRRPGAQRPFDAAKMWWCAQSGRDAYRMSSRRQKSPCVAVRGVAAPAATGSQGFQGTQGFQGNDGGAVVDTAIVPFMGTIVVSGGAAPTTYFVLTSPTVGGTTDFYQVAFAVPAAAVVTRVRYTVTSDDGVFVGPTTFDLWRAAPPPPLAAPAATGLYQFVYDEGDAPTATSVTPVAPVTLSEGELIAIGFTPSAASVDGIIVVVQGSIWLRLTPA